MEGKRIIGWVIELAAVILFSIFLHWIFQLNFYWNNGWSWFIIGILTAIMTFINLFADIDFWDDMWGTGIFGIPTALILLCAIIFGIANNGMAKGQTFYFRTNEMITVIEDTEEVSAFPNLLGENNDTSNLPLIGIPEAMKKAETEMGRYPALGSQFELRMDDMTSQSINGELKYVIPLQPRSMFKWKAEAGSFGYFIIDRNSGEVEFVKETLRTTTAAPFGSATKRIVNKYLKSLGISGLVTDISPEVDDDGKFHYVATIYTLDGWFGSYPVVKGVVDVDAETLNCAYYSLDKIPEYVDRVYPEWMFEQYIEYYGKYKHGFWNSVFAQKDELMPTKGMDVIYIDGECWYYTGFTSVGKDESSNGIIMMNSRTGEMKYHITYGISEHEAMTVAEGLVKDKEYVASYPLLLQVGGVETYFMIMRDTNENLVGYAFVSYKDYTKAAVETNLLDAQSAYIASLRSSNNTEIMDESKIMTIQGVIESIASEVVDGNTVYYIKLDASETVFQMHSDLNIDVVFAKAGMNVQIKYYHSGHKVESVVEITFEDKESSVVPIPEKN